MTIDNSVNVDSFDEAVRRIVAVFYEPGSRQDEGDILASPIELQVRWCLDELLCCYELRTQEFLSEERFHQTRLQRCHQSWQRRADLTGKIAADKALEAHERCVQHQEQLAKVQKEDAPNMRERLAEQEAALQARVASVVEREAAAVEREAREAHQRCVQEREQLAKVQKQAVPEMQKRFKEQEAALQAREALVAEREAAAAEREATVQLRVKQTEQEFAARERSMEERRQDIDVLNHRLESREDALSKREPAMRAREANLEDRERNIAVHELKSEEERRLVAEADRAQREALELLQRQVAEQRARCAEAERKLGERTEALALREQSVSDPVTDVQRLHKPPTAPDALAAWEVRLASRDRAVAESRREQEAQERMLRERERRLGDIDVLQTSARGPDPAPRLPAPAALPPAAHHSRPGSLDSTTLAAHAVPHGLHCGDLSSAAGGQKSRKTARKRVHDHDVADTALVLETRPAAQGGSFPSSAGRDLGVHDAGPSSKRHASEPHRVTSAFARFAAPLTRLLVGGEAPASPS